MARASAFWTKVAATEQFSSSMVRARRSSAASCRSRRCLASSFLELLFPVVEAVAVDAIAEVVGQGTVVEDILEVVVDDVTDFEDEVNEVEGVIREATDFDDDEVREDEVIFEVTLAEDDEEFLEGLEVTVGILGVLGVLIHEGQEF